MNYHTMHKKALAGIMALMLGGNMAHAVPSKGSIAHAQAPVWIQEHFKCTPEFAGLIRDFLNRLNDTIYHFLDYKNNKQNCAWHIEQFTHRINELNTLITSGKCDKKNDKADKKNEKAVAECAKIVKLMGEIRTEIQSAKGKRGVATLIAAALGAKLNPVIDKLKGSLPVALTIEERLKAAFAYNTELSPLVYIAHLTKRLEIK